MCFCGALWIPAEDMKWNGAVQHNISRVTLALCSLKDSLCQDGFYWSTVQNSQVRVHPSWTGLERIDMDYFSPMSKSTNCSIGFHWFWMVLCLHSVFWLASGRASLSLLALLPVLLMFVSVCSCHTHPHLSVVWVTWPETSTSCVSLKHTHVRMHTHTHAYS